jgi:hypothetical protein
VRVRALVPLLLLGASPPPPLPAGDPSPVRAERIRARVETVAGELQVVRLEFVNGRHVHRLVLAGAVAFEDRESHSVAVAASHPDNAPARVVLLRLTTGGSGCPAFFMVAEAREDGSLAHTERFGNCSPRARTRFAAGVLDVDLPRSGGAAAESWRYRGGTLERRMASGASAAP